MMDWINVYEVKPKSEIDKCSEFLLINGWDRVEDNDCRSYCKDGCICVDLTEDGEMVFIDDSGDFLHKKADYYALIGVLLEHRQISALYKSAQTPN